MDDAGIIFSVSFNGNDWYTTSLRSDEISAKLNKYLTEEWWGKAYHYIKTFKVFEAISIEEWNERANLNRASFEKMLKEWRKKNDKDGSQGSFGPDEIETSL